MTDKISNNNNNDNIDFLYHCGQFIRLFGLTYPFFSGMMGTLSMDLVLWTHVNKLSSENQPYFVTTQLLNLLSPNEAPSQNQNSILDFFGLSLLTTLLTVGICYQLVNAPLALLLIKGWLISFVIYMTGDVLTNLSATEPSPVSMMQFFLAK
jgi:hypothetical protein